MILAVVTFLSNPLFAILQVAGFLWNTYVKKIDSFMGILGLFPNHVILSDSQYESEIVISDMNVLKENRFLGKILFPFSM